MSFITKTRFAIAANIAIVGYLVYIMASTPPALGYEVSIYDAYSPSFWVTFFVLYLFNVTFILFSKNKKISLVGLSGILASTLVLGLLPLQRNYFCIDGGDSLTHLTYVKNLVYEGELGLTAFNIDPYPLPHILTAGLANAGMGIHASVQVMPILYYVWFVVFIYLLANRLFQDNQVVAVIMILALLPILAINHYYPSLFFFYLLPSLFYFTVKRWWVPVAIIAVALPFTHPASSLLLLVFMVLVGIICYAQGYRLGCKGYLAVIVAFAMAWGMWLVVLNTQLVNYANTVPAMALGLTENAPPSQFRDIMRGIALSDMSFSELFLLYIKRYGQMHLIMGLGIMGAISVIYLWIRKKCAGSRCILGLSILCLIYCAMYAASFFVSEYILLGRIYSYALLLSIFPAAILLSNLAKRRGVYMGVIVVLLFATNCFAVFTLYDSPFNKKPSQQITMSEINAVSWLLNNKELEAKCYDLRRQQSRMAMYVLGYNCLEGGNMNGLNSRGLPPHFGYNKYETLGEALGEDCYLITNTKNIEVSTKVYPEYEDIWAYHPDDYVKLGDDGSLTLVYSDNGTRIYRVKGG